MISIGVSYRCECVRGEGEWQPSGLRASRGAGDGAVPDRLQRRVGARPHVGGGAREGHVREGRNRGDDGRGVFVFSDGGLNALTVVCSVDPSSGSPVFTDGPFIETKEHLGGFAVVDVPDDAEARYWAGRIAVAVGWPQEVHRFPHRMVLSTDTRSDALS